MLSTSLESSLHEMYSKSHHVDPGTIQSLQSTVQFYKASQLCPLLYTLCCQVHGFIHNMWIFGAENCLWMDQDQISIFLLIAN